MKEPLLLKPATKDYLWGGHKLKKLYNKEADTTVLAECWELSCHKDGLCLITNGEHAGKTLYELLEEHPEYIGVNKKADEFPILVKLIDAKDDLSVQVHPDDDYSRKNEGDNGKTEMWYVIDAEPGATLIYGLNKSLTKEDFRMAISQGNLEEYVNAVNVKKGDVFFIPAGMLHGIGKGIVIAEVQQSSNVTYRVFDSNRKDANGNSRPLHIEKAIDVTTLTPEPLYEAPANDVLAKCQYFTVKRINIETNTTLKAGKDSFQHLLVTEGEAVILYNSKNYCASAGQSLFIPAGLGEYKVLGKATLILSTV